MNKIKSIFLFLFVLTANLAYAQQPARVSIKGTIKDADNNEGAYATVMLLNPHDSTLQNFTQSNEHGAFVFNNVKNTTYLLKVSLISYLPLQINVPASTNTINDLGIIIIKPIAKELFEVVIRTAKAPLTIRGDTIEYDATTFKAPPGSTVEDLLRRLPGIEVDAAGNLKTQGKDVKRVYVDGKTFFGDDPTGATKNLDANAVSKVQVFDEKSEQSKLTGVDDGVKEKAMNLELKEEYKKGSFGKVTIAGGSNEEGVLRCAGRGNFNRFDKTSQLSFIGYANNINETGVNWEDYNEFKGQSTFDDYDNGDFGFSTGRGRYYMFSDDGSPISYFDGRGFTNNFGGGVNYNFDNKKTKLNTSYFYKNNQQTYDEFGYKETFFSDSSFFNNDTSKYSDTRQSHTVAARIEQNIDSNNVIIIKANFRYSTLNSQDKSNSLYSVNETDILNNLFTNNSVEKYSWKVTSAAIYRHKFKKKGRSFAISAAYNKNPGNENDKLFSSNHFYIPTFLDEIHRLADQGIDKQQIKSSLLYTEPLSKRFFQEIFYNFNTSSNKVNNQVKNALFSDLRIDSLSVYYTNKVMINRLGTDIRYSFNGLNIMLGVAGQYLQMDGRYSVDKNMPLITDPINKTYWSLSPKFSFSYEFPNNMWLSMDYGYELTEPSFEYLQPTPNIQNPLFRTQGNINLKPERTHAVSLNYNYYNPSSFSNVGFNIDYNYCDNSITYNQKLIWADSVGFITISKPENNSKSNNVNSWLWTSYPIIKTKFTNDWSLGFYYDNNGAYVNDIFNKTKIFRYYINTNFNITPGQKLVMAVYGRASIYDTKLSINTDRNQFVQQYTAGMSIKWQFAKKSFFESNFDYQFYRNSQYSYDKNLPIFNASVRQLLGKKNHFEIRLAAFDILNKRQYIEQYTYQNYYNRTTAATLARYFMISFSYNIKGYETKLKKNRNWD
ncbi:MAG: outer membrane beta-barrel protein [Bacteroidota bacterium]